MAKGILIHADSMRDANMFVATGVAVVDPFSYIEANGSRIIVSNVLEADAIRRDSRATDVWVDDEFGVREQIRQGVKSDVASMEGVRRALERASLDEVAVPATFPIALADYLRGHGITVTPDKELFDLRRRVKGDAQVEAMKVAQRATEAAFAAARELIGSASPGPGGLVEDGQLLTCERVSQRIVDTLRAHGCGGEPPIVGAGPKGALVHDHGSGPIHPGESIIIDIFPQHEATRYCADMTRTFCYGEAPERLVHMHRTIKEALDRSIEAIRPGVSGTSVWEAACDVIEAARYRTTRQLADGERLDEDFFHGLGHGVGIDVHEQPGMSLGGTAELLEGDVVTVEPGVYRKDFGGVRLEDMVLVTAGGRENLTQFDYELEIRP
jgi:Xaa-Pro aminopeptidase